MPAIYMYTSLERPDDQGNIRLAYHPDDDSNPIRHIQPWDQLVLVDPNGKPEDALPYYRVKTATHVTSAVDLCLVKLS